MKQNKVLGQYKNGNYFVTIYEDGTKIRQTKDDRFVADFAENCDVKITDKCDLECKWCYEGCSKSGRHAELFDSEGNPTQEWLKDLKPFTELALNGNDLSHPDLQGDNPRLLTYLKEKKVIPNITVSQVHFEREYNRLLDWTSRKLIYGLGVSLLNSSSETFLLLAQSIPNLVIHTIAGIVTCDDFSRLEKISPKILILGYKNSSRGSKYLDKNRIKIDDRLSELKHSLEHICKKVKVLSFDNLALEQLSVKEILFKDKEDQWETFYMGEDGTATFYIDAVNNQFSRHSCIPLNERKDSTGKSVVEMFKEIQL